MAKTAKRLTEPVVQEKQSTEDEGTSLRAGTLIRGLAILDILVAASQPLSLAEIAAEAGLDLSTTLRLLRTLEETRRVIRMEEGKRYFASPKTLRPLPLLHPLEQLRREAYPVLRELASKVSKTVVLVAYLGMERVVVEMVQSHGSLNPYYSTWLQGPLHASGPGKALLLTMDEDKRRQILGPEPYSKHAAQTLTDWSALHDDLEAAMKLGVVTVRDEFYDGLSAMAANVLSWNGKAVGCIAITSHTSEFHDEARFDIATELKNCVRLLPLQAPSLKLLEHFISR